MAPKATRDPTQLFTASHVARFCQVDLKTVHNWVEKGQIDHFRTPGRHLRFRHRDVLTFLRRFGYPTPEALREERPSVVVLDGDPGSLGPTRRSLARRFEVQWTTDWVDALVVVGRCGPDALLAHVVPDDPWLAAAVRRFGEMEETRHVRVVAHGNDEEAQVAARQAGAHAYVTRGDTTALRDALERVLGLERA